VVLKKTSGKNTIISEVTIHKVARALRITDETHTDAIQHKAAGIACMKNGEYKQAIEKINLGLQACAEAETPCLSATSSLGEALGHICATLYLYRAKANVLLAMADDLGKIEADDQVVCLMGAARDALTVLLSNNIIPIAEDGISDKVSEQGSGEGSSPGCWGLSNAVSQIVSCSAATEDLASLIECQQALRAHTSDQVSKLFDTTSL
jgi:hypothetical protein